MTPFEEFDALNRTVKVMKAYRRQQEDTLHPLNTDLVQAYMSKHLLSQDLHLWLRLERQDNLGGYLRSANLNGSLKRRMCEFKRAAHGLREAWQQAHSLN
jgi:hypothetical protein